MPEEKQIKFYAKPDVSEHLAKQQNVTAYIHALIRADMQKGGTLQERVDKLERLVSELTTEKR